MLTMSDEITLDKVMTLVNVLEIVNYQLDSYEQKKIERNQMNKDSAIKVQIRKLQYGLDMKESFIKRRRRQGVEIVHIYLKAFLAQLKIRNSYEKLGHYQRCCKN